MVWPKRYQQRLGLTRLKGVAAAGERHQSGLFASRLILALKAVWNETELRRRFDLHNVRVIPGSSPEPMRAYAQGWRCAYADRVTPAAANSVAAELRRTTMNTLKTAPRFISAPANSHGDAVRGGVGPYMTGIGQLSAACPGRVLFRLPLRTSSS